MAQEQNNANVKVRGLQIMPMLWQGGWLLAMKLLVLFKNLNLLLNQKTDPQTTSIMMISHQMCSTNSGMN